MLHYELSIDAEKDLQDIARYTLNTWGKTIFEQYRNGLKKTFNAIGNREVLEKGFSRLKNKINDKEWDEVLGTNLSGPFKVSQELFPMINNNETVGKLLHFRKDMC